MHYNENNNEERKYINIDNIWHLKESVIENERKKIIKEKIEKKKIINNEMKNRYQ